MKELKKTIRNAARDLVRRGKILAGVPQPAGMVGLSEESVRAAYGPRSDVSIRLFEKEDARPLRPPKCLPEDETLVQPHAAFPGGLPACRMVALEIRNADFTFQQHHLLDDEHRVIYEPQMHFEQLPIRGRFLVPCRKLEGTVAYLSNTLFCQYGHLLQRQLPLLQAYWELFGKDSIDYYYIGDGRVKAYALEMLAKMGVRPGQVVGFPCRADRALICARASDAEQAPKAQPSFHMDAASHAFLQRHLFAAEKRIAGRKLFVMRGDVSGRRELNLPAVRRALEPQGFEFVTTQGMSVQAEADLFGHAEVVVAVHGAALHNLLFARPGTTVVEIFPYDYFEESNYVIANHSGCDYFYLTGAPLDSAYGSGSSLMERNRADVQIDVSKLLRLLKQAGALS